MRLALISDIYPPLRSSGAVQLRDLSIEFARQGHAITVMVASPELDEASRVDIMDGVEVLRLRTLPTRDRSYIWRTFAEFLMPFWMLRGFKNSPVSLHRFDAVIWYSPTIFLGPFIKALKRRSKCPAYLIIRDIFPEWAWDMGLIQSRLLCRAFKAIASYQYAQADVIGIQTPGNYVYFEAWQQNHPNTQIEVLHNWLSPASNVGSTIQLKHTKLADRKIFVYAGNMGVAQNTKVFLDLAACLKDNPEIGFLFVGRGSESAALASQYGALDNVLFHDEIEPSEIPGLYAQCHVGLVALDPRHKSHNIPGKFLSYMQAGLPVLACVNPGNDLLALIGTHGVGAVVDANHPEQLGQVALELLSEVKGGPKAFNRCNALMQKMFASEAAVRQIVSALM